MKTTISLKRLVPGLIIGPVSWLGPYIVMNSLFLPALIQHLDAPHKIELVALFSTCGMIVAAISNMIAGALSDKTKSRFGKRAPWIMGGAFVFMLAMMAASVSPTVPVLLAAWMVGQAALNFIVAPMVAWIDFAPKDGRGTASSAYGGLGMALGNNGFNVIGAMFLSQFRLGFVIFGIIAFVGVLIAVLIVHEPSNVDDVDAPKQPKPKLTLKDAKAIFPGWSVGRDYYLALMGKLFQGVGNFAITGYILYIMTDFLHRGSQTQSSIQLINLIMLVFGIFMGFVAGPVSDKFKILKYPVGFSTIFLAFGALALFFLRDNTGIIIYAFAAGIGMGMWNSLDNLLNLEVIPDQNRVAFFLGVYNLGNTVTQAIAPVIAAAVISLFGFSAIFLVSFVFSLIGGILMLSIKSVKR
ncbi:MFS transporter [Levilactobacillus zymae]|uniref:Membrane protein, probable n=1 Tax=Levilactobacillus zymae TaxID=267363 RepID=A0A1Y6JZH8_9LACO|nr:MFS transporter [Levilactobacillus zymae]SMS15349.1 membrane protein, probable [Levilactobacillus zymae]